MIGTIVIICGILLAFSAGFKVVYEWQDGLVFTFGKYKGKKQAGLRWIFPIIQKMRKIDKRVRIIDVEPQECITKDSVTVQLDAVLYFKVIDTAKAVINVADFREASYKLGQTSLRDIVGKKELDELLTEKDIIGKEVMAVIQAPTDNWGIKITNVEIKDVVLPQEMKRAMAKEAEASREKKARLIKADAEFEASKKFRQAADIMSDKSMILRQLQTWQEIGAEQNSTMILVPADLISKVVKK